MAVDLEGSGAQDGDDEDILEIAVVRLVEGRPEVTTAYATLIDPGRPIPARPWISPGLAGDALAGAPRLDVVAPQLAGRLDGAYLVGHNVGVDWRLIHRRIPQIHIAGLIDTYRMARALPGAGGKGLADLLDRYRLTDAVSAAAPRSRPHRALWDAVGAAFLLDVLVRQRWSYEPRLEEILAVTAPKAEPEPPATLFD
ncbi:3'-5' exonuclease [Paractinoplanes atraurantiacus]|uniref:3'-5' exonuclease n=1 Tax=Paractinoplanes atraurantiacus TaxID=1036182 RepID=UPI0015CF30BD|nr:3'-5' exonuclease [Actinoplanes atraurantiacus]